MKKSVFYITLCLFTLSSAYCRAERRTVEQNFQALTGNGIEYKSSNTIGETDFVTYTCSGGAKFNADAVKTDSKIAIFLESAGSQVTTTKIENLDSLRIKYYYSSMPDPYRDITVSISTDGSEWNEIPVVHQTNGLKTVKMPRAGDYYVRIAFKSSYKVYIFQIDYIYIDLSECPNCFLYKPE